MEQASGAATFGIAAEAYDRHVGRYSGKLAEQLIDAAGVRADHRVLDVGCGPGALTRALADRVGAEHVTAVDPSEPFVAACRERIPGADVRLAAAEQLPFDDASFDRALSQLVVNFMTDAVAGVGQMVRVTKPGGVVGCCVWDYGGEMTLLRRFWDAAVAVDPSAAELDEGGRMKYCTPEALNTLWWDTGLVDVSVGPVVVTTRYDDFDQLWSPFEAAVGPSGAYATSLDAEGRAALRAEYHRRLGAPEGPFELSARAWCATGTRPES